MDAMQFSPQAIELIAERFRILGEPLRIRLLQALRKGEKSVGQLAEEVGASQPNVSKHLRILLDGGFVGRRQSGNVVYCFIQDPRVFELCDAVCASVKERFRDRARVVAEIRRGLTRR